MVSKDSPNYKEHGALTGAKTEDFRWTEKRYTVAALLAEGKYLQREIAEICGISHKSVTAWKQNMEFMAHVDKLTLEYELATRAGLLRECYHGIIQKRDEILSDKTTHLDYVKAAADIQGLKKSEVDVTGKVIIDVTAEEALDRYEKLLTELGEQT